MAIKKLALTTPVEETKTTNEVRIKQITFNFQDDGNHYGFVEYREGELDGETFTEHRVKSARIPTTELATELGKTVTTSDTNEAAILKAVYDALVAVGAVGAGTIS